MNSDLSEVRSEIAEVEAAPAPDPGSLIGALRQARLEALHLLEATLSARIEADATGAPVEIVRRQHAPDAAEAERLLGEIQGQMKVIAATEAEIEKLAGLTQALAVSRLETEKLILASLKAAWMQAEYGLAIPVVTRERGNLTATAPSAQEDPPTDETREVPAWADPDHPEIDYSTSPYPGFAEAGYSFHGNWGIELSENDLDDSDEIWAVNVSAWGDGYNDKQTLNMGCIEGQPRLIYNPDKYMLSDRNNKVKVDYRIDDQSPVSTNWSITTSNQAAGLFGAEAPRLMRKLIGAESLFIRFTERDGDRHEARFALAGTERVVERISAVCGFSLLELSREDIRQVQTLLNAAGFNSGPPDGVWGDGSKRAMRAFQEARGLPVTGAISREVLSALGL